MADRKSATLYRMVLPDHVCPYGEEAKGLLEKHGFTIDDRLLQSREEVDAFMNARGLQTTPWIVINGEPVGGSDDLEQYFARNTAAPTG